MGFTAPLDELDQDTFEMLLFIDAEIDSVKASQMNKGGSSG